MANPYRDAAPGNKELVEVETNDLVAEVYYIDEGSTVKKVSINFVGQPIVADHMYKSRSPERTIHEGRGADSFFYWLKNSYSIGMYKMGDTYIPIHKMLKIETTITKLIKQVLPEER